MTSEIYGWSELSDLNIEGISAAKIQVLPHKPSNTPTRDITSSDTQLVVNIAPMIDPDNGGADVLSYHI